jgi:rubrerythrin
MDDAKLLDLTLEQIKTIDKAINMERNAKIFYAQASEQVDSVDGKKTFRWLADFEASHEARLSSRRNELVTSPVLAGKPVPHHDLDLESSETYNDGELDPVMSDVEILILALKNEQRARGFYERKAKHEEGDMKELLITLMNDEDRHIRILQGQIDHLQLNRKWATLDSITQDQQS